jgi:dTMP kinase
MTRGSFIVLYGINNLGKSTQAKKLVERLQSEGHKTVYLKYPIYDLAPSGPMLNAYLREGNPHNLNAREAQLLYVLNRTQYQTELEKLLDAGTHVVAEDYTGTGICWGIGAGVDPVFMEVINSHILKEDLVFLFTGTRFTEATEASHKHETNDTLITAVDTIHKAQGEKNGWITIDANNTIEEIHEQLWAHTQSYLAMS